MPSTECTNEDWINSPNAFQEVGCIHTTHRKQGIADPEQLRAYILNMYHTMMLRGIHGTYVYVCNEPLREYMRGVIGG